MGGKAEGMAQAFTAVSDDVSFLDYNPAGSAIMQDTELAVFHNAWIADSALDALAYSMRLGNFGIGAGLRFFYVPFTEYNIFGQRISGGYYSESVVTLNCSYTFFRGYDFRGLSVGVNLKGAWRTVPDFSDKNSDLVVEGSGEPGQILNLTKTGLVIACGEGAVEILSLQAEGGKRMAAPDYFRGHPLKN